MTEVRAIAGINPENNVCCYVGGQDQEEVMQLIEQGLIVVPVMVEKARTMFGEVFEFAEQNPKRDGDSILDKLRASGLSIDGDNAYKRDLLDAVVGSMLVGKQNTNQPPAGHWAQRFWDIGREYGALPSDAPAIVLPMPVMPEQPEDAIDDSWLDGYNAALRMREDCMRAIEAARMAVAPPKSCTWKLDDDTGAYNTGCGKLWHFTDGGEPEEHGALFCHHCAGSIIVERRELFAYQVGDNDIVAAYDPAGAIITLFAFAGYGDDFDESEVELVSDKVLDSTEAFDIDEGKTITLEKTLRQELAELTEPTYMLGWE